MKISYTNNFESLNPTEVANIINSNEIIPIVMIPISNPTNNDSSFDVTDIFFVPVTAIKQNGINCKSVIIPFDNVILSDEDEAKKIWHSCSMYDEREKYESVKDVLNSSMIFKVLSDKDVKKLQDMILEEQRKLLSSISATKAYLSSIDK